MIFDELLLIFGAGVIVPMKKIMRSDLIFTLLAALFIAALMSGCEKEEGLHPCQAEKTVYNPASAARVADTDETVAPEVNAGGDREDDNDGESKKGGKQ